MLRDLLPAAALSALLLTGAGPAAAAAPEVVASIKPVHSLVAAVMEGVGSPHLIVRGGGSPHGFAMRPSDARALARAELVVWVGPALEVFLDGPLGKLAGAARVLSLSQAPGVVHLPAREGGAWDGHHHDDGDGDDGDGVPRAVPHAAPHAAPHADVHDGHDRGETHAHAEDHDHDAADGHDGAAGHGDADGHGGGWDQHLWLDPRNAQAMVAAIAAALQAADPANAAAYAANAAAMEQRLAALDAELGAVLEPVADRPFVQFHDAFQYLEARYGLNAVGSVTVSPDRRPGAERLAELRQKIRDAGAVCIFTEPQFPPDLVDVVIEGSAVRTATLDPLGADIPDGPDLYGTLMRGNAEALRRCLSPAG